MGIDNLLTPAEVARLLKLNLLTIYRYIKSGDLVAARFGRSYRIKEVDLEKFINEKQAQ